MNNNGTLGVLLIAVCALALGFPPAASYADALPAGDAGNGRTLFVKLCSGCHGVDGRGGAHTFMPHVGNLTRKGYVEQLPDEYLYLVIAKGGAAANKSSYMPAWESKLSEQDIADIIAHIRRLPGY